MRRKNRSCSPTIEGLETRELLSWTLANVPAHIAPPTGGFNFANAWSSSGNIANQNINQAWTFIAPHTGNYTFTVTGTPFTQQTMNGPYTSAMVPIFALFDHTGSKMVTVTNGMSKATYTQALAQGQRYELAVTNLTGRQIGAYSVQVTGQIAMQSRVINYGNGVSAQADAYITGNTLVLDLYGFNSSWWTTHTDSVSIYLKNAQGQTILTWGASCTNGPNHHSSNTWSLNLSNYNMTGLSYISMTLN